MLLAAEVMADAVITCFTHPELIAQAQDEFRQRLNGQTYVSLIPKEVSPHIIE